MKTLTCCEGLHVNALDGDREETDNWVGVTPRVRFVLELTS